MGTKGTKLSREELKELKDNTYFNKKELQSWYIDFMTDCPSGYLTEQDFAQIYQQFFPLGDPEKFATFIFKVFDQNSDGCISFKEFVTALSITSRGSLDEKLDWAFSLYDVDKDGFITKDEMLYIVKSIYSVSNVEWFQKVTGLPSDGECNTPEKRIERIFETMDLNDDGKVTVREFRNGFKCDPWIVETLAIQIPEVEEEEGMADV